MDIVRVLKQGLFGAENAELAFADHKVKMGVRAFSVREGIDRLFEVTVTAACSDAELDLDRVAGRAAAFRLATGHGHKYRAWSGICREIEQIRVEEDGVYIHQESKKEFLPPLRQFAFFARTGDSWKWRGTVSGKLQREEFENLGVQEVTVPAGTYTAVAVHQSNPDTTDQATFWLAPGVGVVKLSGKSELASDDPKGGKVVFEWSLKKFESGKK